MAAAFKSEKAAAFSWNLHRVRRHIEFPQVGDKFGHVVSLIGPQRDPMIAWTIRHRGYAVSGRLRKRIEEVFGWTKTAAGFRKTRHRGLAHVGWMFTLTATTYNLVRLTKLVGAVG
jgi:hypothetical protein